MYYEFESRYNMKPLIFDDEELTVGETSYSYKNISKLEVTSAPLFSSYGIMTLTDTEGKEHTIAFPRTYAAKIKRVIKEMEREKEKNLSGEGTAGSGSGGPDPYEELKKLKELLDLDIITEEEFAFKKKQLLNL